MNQNLLAALAVTLLAATAARAAGLDEGTGSIGVTARNVVQTVSMDTMTAKSERRGNARAEAAVIALQSGDASGSTQTVQMKSMYANAGRRSSATVRAAVIANR